MMNDYNVITMFRRDLRRGLTKYLAEVKSVVSNSQHLVSKRDERQWESFRLARTRGTMVCKLVINCFACPEQKRGAKEEGEGGEGRTQRKRPSEPRCPLCSRAV